jgi:hypothetical protein
MSHLLRFHVIWLRGDFTLFLDYKESDVNKRVGAQRGCFLWCRSGQTRWRRRRAPSLTQITRVYLLTRVLACISLSLSLARPRRRKPIIYIRSHTKATPTSLCGRAIDQNASVARRKSLRSLSHRIIWQPGTHFASAAPRIRLRESFSYISPSSALATLSGRMKYRPQNWPIVSLLIYVFHRFVASLTGDKSISAAGRIQQNSL